MKTIIGRVDRAHFRELGLKKVDVKVDTGAYTSSIHCHKVREVVVEGKKAISFYILDPSHPQYEHQEFVSTQYKRKSVKSSNGGSEERFIIQTTISLFGKVYPIELSLSDRGDMKYPVLLGRRFLSKRFIVDSSKKNLSYKSRKKK